LRKLHLTPVPAFGEKDAQAIEESGALAVQKEDGGQVIERVAINIPTLLAVNRLASLIHTQ